MVAAPTTPSSRTQTDVVYDDDPPGSSSPTRSKSHPVDNATSDDDDNEMQASDDEMQEHDDEMQESDGEYEYEMPDSDDEMQELDEEIRDATGATGYELDVSEVEDTTAANPTGHSLDRDATLRAFLASLHAHTPSLPMYSVSYFIDSTVNDIDAGDVSTFELAQDAHSWPSFGCSKMDKA